MLQWVCCVVVLRFLLELMLILIRRATIGMLKVLVAVIIRLV